MEDKNMTSQEGLRLIQQMIQVAKDDYRENGGGWLLWGWLLFIASVSSMIFAYLQWWNYIQYAWLGALAAGLLTGFILYLYGRSHKQKNAVVKTYVQELVDRLGTGFFISLLILVAANFMGGGKPGFIFGYYYVLYAFWMFIHGSALRFRPLIMGAAVNWAAAIAIFLINDFRYDMLVSSIAVLTGYLIPGYMLRAKYRKTMNHKVEKIEFEQ